ncbi:hypothetical protein Gasu2_23200 [Galdieria sulphuraria]|uniref:Uncharacterized protein n=1 Tax=Galdieria sulphuraria TaxID=130081 RepID=M2W1Z4_GALSU|nr:uncharacterized protein Gasu_29270 [Galdieria sulphuraria]EME29706.1 hypothetical protein Gasu_29270 [Galdieria sulphuraria]GJD08005.1 hypothetical protein Gasu2_23200 [Galdieria sulphuraria]|eukprot:XP_005706226.1 hypothetical protein Gasu_29270 [Galdieria sulphuraria]
MAKSAWKKQKAESNESSVCGLAMNGLPVGEDLLPKACWESAQEFLCAFPQGAYTTMLTAKNMHSIIALNRHLNRLASSLQALREQQQVVVDDSRDFDCTVSSLRESVILTIREAIFCLEKKLHSFMKQNAKDYAVCVVVLVPLKGRQVVARASSVQWNYPSQHILQCVYFSRQCPGAKDSLWVQQRLPLYYTHIDKNKEHPKELLLVAENNTCLEGSTTNFFVVYSQGYVKTAGNGVLGGIAAQFVEKACQLLHIPLLYDAPGLHDIEDWKEVFITNCIKVVEPVQSIYLPSTMQQRQVNFSIPHYSWTWKIREKVLELMLGETYDVYSDADTFGRKQRLWNHFLQLQS